MKGSKEILKYKIVRNIKHNKYFETAKKEKYNAFQLDERSDWYATSHMRSHPGSPSCWAENVTCSLIIWMISETSPKVSNTFTDIF